MLTSASIKWLSAALFVSLCLNLAAIGFFLGRSSREARGDLLVPPHTIALQALPEERARMLLSQFSESIHPVRQDMSRMREVRGELHRLLVSDPFNHEAFASKLEELTASVARVHGHTNTSFVKITMHMTPVERRMVASLLERPRSARQRMPVWVERNVNQRFDPGEVSEIEYQLRFAASRP